MSSKRQYQESISTDSQSYFNIATQPNAASQTFVAFSNNPLQQQHSHLMTGNNSTFHNMVNKEKFVLAQYSHSIGKRRLDYNSETQVISPDPVVSTTQDYTFTPTINAFQLTPAPQQSIANFGEYIETKRRRLDQERDDQLFFQLLQNQCQAAVQETSKIQKLIETNSQLIIVYNVLISFIANHADILTNISSQTRDFTLSSEQQQMLTTLTTSTLTSISSNIQSFVQHSVEKNALFFTKEIEALMVLSLPTPSNIQQTVSIVVKTLINSIGSALTSSKYHMLIQNPFPEASAKDISTNNSLALALLSYISSETTSVITNVEKELESSKENAIRMGISKEDGQVLESHSIIMRTYISSLVEYSEILIPVIEQVRLVVATQTIRAVINNIKNQMDEKTNQGGSLQVHEIHQLRDMLESVLTLSQNTLQKAAPFLQEVEPTTADTTGAAMQQRKITQIIQQAYQNLTSANDEVSALTDTLIQQLSEKDAQALEEKRKKLESAKQAKLEEEKAKRDILEDSPLSRLRSKSSNVYKELIKLITSFEHATTENTQSSQYLAHIHQNVSLSCTKMMNSIVATEQGVQQCTQTYGEIVKENIDHMQKYLSQVSSTQPPSKHAVSLEHLGALIHYTIAELIVLAKDAIPGILYAKASLVVAISIKEPIFSDRFQAVLIHHCPVSAACVPTPRMTGVELKRFIGYEIKEKRLETTVTYLERITSMLSLHFAWYHIRLSIRKVSEEDFKIATEELWSWTATILNSNIYAFTSTALLLMLRYAGNIFCKLFPKQMIKIYYILVQLYQEMSTVPIIQIGGPEGKTAMINMNVELEQWRATGYVAINPSSRLAMGQASSTAFERITQDDLTSNS